MISPGYVSVTKLCTMLYCSEGSSSSVSSEKLSTDKRSSEDHRKDSKCRIIFHYGPFQGTAR